MVKILALVFFLGTATALPYSTQLESTGSSGDTLIKVAESLGLKTFVSKALSTEVSKIINHDGPFTVFAPNDTAFEVQMQYPTGFVLNEAMLFHVGHGKVMESEMTNERVIKSLLDGRTIRFNVYNGGQVKTANGRRIMKSDNVARNGVVHVVGGVMSSIYRPYESIANEMVNHYPQHSTFMELVKMSKLFSVLNKMDTPMTLFAPTNEAMAAIDPDFINELKNDMTKLRTTIMGHIVMGTWFTPGLINGQSIRTEMGVERPIKTDSNGVIAVGGSSVSLPDIVAANGAIHSIDTIMITKSEVDNMASSQNLIEHINTLIEESNQFTSGISGQGTQSLVSGKGRMSGSYNRMVGSQQFSGEVSANYIPQDVWSQKNARTFTASPSSSGLEHSSWYQHGNGIEEIKEGWGKLSNGANDVVSSLKELGHTGFAVALEKSGVSSMLEETKDGYYTLFAPSNKGWEQVVQSSGDESLATLISSHIVSGIRSPQHESTMETLIGSYIHFDNLNSGRIQAYSPRTSLTANGVPMDGRINTVKSGHIRIYSLTGGISCISSSADGDNTIMSHLRHNGEFSKFVNYAVKFGWEYLFNSKDSLFTIFVPTNEAITEAENKFSEKDIASIMMSNHIVPGSFFKSKMEADGVVKTLAGHRIAVHSSGSVLELTGGVHVTKMDMAASNGVVHEVDKLIFVDFE